MIKFTLLAVVFFFLGGAVYVAKEFYTEKVAEMERLEQDRNAKIKDFVEDVSKLWEELNR